MTHQQLRAQCWISAWSAVAGAITCETSDAATSWADKALQAFDERFPSTGTSKPFIETDKFIIKSKEDGNHSNFR